MRYSAGRGGGDGPAPRAWQGRRRRNHPESGLTAPSRRRAFRPPENQTFSDKKMRTPFFIPAVLAVLVLAAPTTARCYTEQESILRYQQFIETCRERIVEDEKILREYDVEMRRATENDPATVRRRTEIRIIKKHYNDEIDANKAKVVDYYRKIQELKKHGKDGQ